jgi:hypothetical protein
VDAVVEVDKSRQRMIFHASMQYQADELEKLEKFRKYIKDNNFDLPAG